MEQGEQEREEAVDKEENDEEEDTPKQSTMKHSTHYRRALTMRMFPPQTRSIQKLLLIFFKEVHTITRVSSGCMKMV